MMETDCFDRGDIQVPEIKISKDNEIWSLVGPQGNADVVERFSDYQSGDLT